MRLAWNALVCLRAPSATFERRMHVSSSLAGVDWAIMTIFVAEIVIKFLAEGKEPWLFFSDPWNIFDFFIVVVGFIPIGGESGGGAVQVLRLVRLLRVLKVRW